MPRSDAIPLPPAVTDHPQPGERASADTIIACTDDPTGTPRARRSPLTESRRFVFGLVAFVLLAFGTGAGVGRNFLSPAQRAAQAAPPKASVITSPVKFDVLQADVVFRADVKDASPVPVQVPSGLGSAKPVVSKLLIHKGDSVGEGQQLLRVAERPIFAFEGGVPAFRDLAPGVTGVDVDQVQAGLHRLGLGTGSDAAGTFGPGTQAAVTSFYQHAEVPVSWSSPEAQSTLADAQKTLATALTAASAAKKKLAQDEKSTSPDPAVIKADKATVQQTTAAVTAADKALTKLRKTTGVVVPRGEIAFVPKLPARVVSLDVGLGSTATESGVLAQIGSGGVIVTGSVDPMTAGQLKVGMAGTAALAADGPSLQLTLNALGAAKADGTTASSGSAAATGSQDAAAGGTGEQAGAGGQSGQVTLSLTAKGQVPAAWMGQNIAVTLSLASSGVKVLIVPVSAISTTTGGKTFVTVVNPGTGRQRDVPVTLGMSSSGQQAVTPVGEALAAGDQVVVGQSVAGQQ